MAYQVELLKKATGDVKTITMKLHWDASSWFWWTMGNMGCDCNRAIKFGDEDTTCGDGVRFVAIKATLPDGTEIPLDSVLA